MPEGRITRGTTGTNRLRRVDRWIATQPAFLRPAAPLVVDLGYGAAPWTAAEMWDRLRQVRPAARVVGIEIDPERVAAAQSTAQPGLEFVRGGFEIPLPDGAQADVVRAMNVLRQYEEHEVPAAWARMAARLAPGGIIVDGTCSENGRVSSWVEVDADGPRSLTISLRLVGLARPSVVAERLPKVLIHRNVPGERVNTLLERLDRCWARAAPYGEFGEVQRWLQAIDLLRADLPVLGARKRWRLGELTVPWEVVSPR